MIGLIMGRVSGSASPKISTSSCKGRELIFPVFILLILLALFNKERDIKKPISSPSNFSYDTVRPQSNPLQMVIIFFIDYYICRVADLIAQLLFLLTLAQ